MAIRFAVDTATSESKRHPIFPGRKTAAASGELPYNDTMAERDNKPWQFSLGRMLGAVAQVCISLAVAVPLLNNCPRFVGMVAAAPVAGSAIGTIMNGVKGAVIGASIGMGLLLFAVCVMCVFVIIPVDIF